MFIVYWLNSPFTDINECYDGTRCRNGQCINTIGSYHCQCPEGYMLLPSRAECIDTREEPCYMKYENDTCTMAMRTDITRFKCCCSMGAAWGDACEACPEKNTGNLFWKIKKVS